MSRKGIVFLLTLVLTAFCATPVLASVGFDGTLYDTFDNSEKFTSLWSTTVSSAELQSDKLYFSSSGELKFKAYNNVAKFTASIYLQGENQDACPQGGFIIRESGNTYYRAVIMKPSGSNYYVLRIAKYVDGERIDYYQNYTFPIWDSTNNQWNLKLTVVADGDTFTLSMNDDQMGNAVEYTDELGPVAGSLSLIALQTEISMDNFSLVSESVAEEDETVLTQDNWTYLFLSSRSSDCYSKTALESLDSESFSRIMARVVSEWQNVRFGLSNIYAEASVASQIYP